MEDIVLVGYGGHGKSVADCIERQGNVREMIYDNLKSIGYDLPIIIDASAIVSKTAKLGEGTFVGKLAVINAEAQVGRMAIINTKALVEHDCRVGDFTHIAIGATLCGGVCIEERCLIGAGTIIAKNVGEKRIMRSKIELIEKISGGIPCNPVFFHHFLLMEVA